MSCPVLPFRRRRPHRIHPFDAILLHWLTFGLLALSILPMAQWHNAWIGWLPYWLVCVPAALLARHLLPNGVRSAGAGA